MAEGMKPICSHCPIEKDSNGACYDNSGTWTQDTQGNWSFSGSWKCIYYDKATDKCSCD